MKKFTKIMLSVAAVTVVSTAMAVSAMAAEVSVSGDFAGKYDTETGIITLNDAVKSSENSTTLLVVNTDGTVAEDNIFQIDQDDESNGFSEIKVDASKIEEGTTYYVRVGGDGTIQTASFTVGGGSQGETHEVLIGDVDQSGRVTAGDASLVLTLVAEKNTGSLTGDALIAAQKCNGLEDTKVTAADAAAILTYNANKKHDYVNTKIEVAD